MDKQEKRIFREQLLSQEKSDAQLREKFQLETKKMYTENLKKGQRFAYVLTSLLIGFATFIFWVVAKIFEELQIKYELSYAEPVRLASMWAMLFSMVLIVLSLWPAIRGKVGLRFYPKVTRFVSFLLILGIAGIFLGVINFFGIDEGYSIESFGEACILALLIVIVGAYILLSGRIDRGDLKNKAKTLELEYRIAELEEKLNQSADGAKV